jgi:hypothetical protein
MKNVYVVQLAEPVTIQLDAAPHFSGKSTSHVYVVASTFNNAIRAAELKYPGVAIRSINLMNYSGLPIVAGE